MLTVNVSEASKHLNSVIKGGIKTSIMMWGAPGIGKSSIVNKVAEENEMEVIDVRLSQLAPTDLRGLPYVENGEARFAPPSFLPKSGKGLLFLDEVNLAPPAIQNVAMQLVLDRKVGDYTVPDDWFIIAAGNRVEDRAAVSQMPAPLTNRFLHFTVEADLTSWKEYALTSGVEEKIISFLTFRPQLLHSFNKNAIAWPSPRSWDFASDLHKIGLPVDAAVGEGAASEFNSFVKLYSKLPDVDKIKSGDRKVKAPKEPSIIYAITGALVSRSETAEEFYNSMMWLIGSVTEDYVGVFMSDSMTRLRSLGIQGQFVSKLTKSTEAKKFVAKYQELLR
jgi:MoxR-like ATPase